MEDNLFLTKLLEPLTKQELNDCFQRFYCGDMEARETIINHNIRLVWLIVTRVSSTMLYDKKELFSNGCIGLIRAVDTFDATKGYSFSSYACACIKNEIIVYARKENKHMNNVSLEEIVGIEDSEQTREDTIPDDKINIEVDFEKKEIYRIVRHCINDLPDMEKKVVMMYYGFINDKLYTQEEIGKINHISKQYVSKIIEKAKKLIEIKLKAKGIDGGNIKCKRKRYNKS